MNDFQRYLAEEFAEDYQEGRISRREALKLIVSVTGSLLVANSLLAACSPPPESTPLAAGTQSSATQMPQPTETLAVQSTETPLPSETQTSAPVAALPPGGTVAPDDPAVQAGEVQISSDPGAITAYLARPNGEGSYPVALVCHENRGLTAHIQDVARRLGKAGYVAIAVDLLSRHGGTASLSSDQVPGVLGNIEPQQFVDDFISAWNYLRGQPYAQADRVGMVGFCFGGGVTWRVAVGMPELKAAVPFYGPHPAVEDVPSIQAAVLAVYAEHDTRINQGIAAIEEAMQQNGKIYEKVIYPDADHAFHNDTSGRYQPEAARDAWQRTLEWFGRYV